MTFDQMVARYAASGIGDGQRVILFVPEASQERIRGFLSENLPGFEELERDRSLTLGAFEQAYLQGIGAFDPDARIADYAALADRAVADGYAGLRVLGEATGMLTDPELFARWPGYELRADLLAVKRPITALCAYDRRRCGAEVLETMRALHAGLLGSWHDAGPFTIHATPCGGIALSGEIDFAAATTLQRATTEAAGDLSTPRIDVGDLSFLDVAGMRALTAGIRAIGLSHPRVEIVRTTPMFERLWTLLECDSMLDLEVSLA